MLEKEKRLRKPKLPRKRKKACIKAQGRDSYYSTVNLAKVEEDNNCKFWVNSSVKTQVIEYQGFVIPMPTPTRYW